MSRLIYISVLIIILVILGCERSDNPIAPPNNNEGSSVTFYFEKPTSLDTLVVSAKAMVSAPGMDTIVVELTVNPNNVEGTIENIPAGPHRKFEISTFNADTTLTYYGHTFSDVPAGQVITVSITLYPVNHTGTVIVVGTFAPFPPPDEFALKFDGLNDWVDIGDRQALEFGESDFTLSAWFKSYSNGMHQQIIRKGINVTTLGEGRWTLGISPTNKIRVVLNDVTSYSDFVSLGSTDVTDGQWHHVAAVFDRDQALKVYLDGEIEIVDFAIVNFQGPILNNYPVNVYIGRNHTLNSIFNGLIDEVRVWNKTRTQQEIQADMNRHLIGNEIGLLAYWRMDEGEGQILTDLAGNNNGQLGSSSGMDQNDPQWVQTNFPYGN